MVVLSAKRSAGLSVLAGITCIGLAAAGCGSSGSSKPSSTGSSKPTGTASVAYAASLNYLNTKVAFPAFTTAAGYQVSGRAGSPANCRRISFPA